MFKTRTFVAIGVLAVLVVAVLVARAKKDPHLASEGAHGAAKGAPAKVVAADVDQLDVAAPGKPPVTLKKEGGAWKLTAPVADAADASAAEEAVKTLSELEYKEIVAESKDSYERLGIRDEDAVKIIASKAGKTLAALYVGKNGHVRVQDAVPVWQVGKMNRFAFDKDVKMWRNREIVRFEKDLVDRIEASLGGQKLVVKRVPPPPPPAAPASPDGGPPAPPAPPGVEHYTLVEGQAAVGGALDETVPPSILGALGHLDIAEFADGVAADAAGLSPPRATLDIVLTDGSKKSIAIGKEEGEFAYAQVGERIFKVRKTTADALVRAPLEWRDKTLAKLDAKDVTRIDIVKGTDHVVVERVDGTTWKMTEPKQPEDFDGSRAQSQAMAFTNLRGAQISSLAAKDAKTGLAKPTGVVKVWTKSSGAAPAAVVTVGALDGKAYYVQASGRPEVFTVPDASVNRWLKTASDFKKPAGGDGPPGMGGMPPGMPPGMRMPAGHP